MENDQQRHLEIDGEWVAVTEEVYLAYMRPVWAKKKRIEREGRCRDENGNRCMRDCLHCPKDRDGRPVSLEQLREDGFDPAGPVDVQKFVEDRQLSEALCVVIDKLGLEDRQIAVLFGIGLSEREIAAQVGLSQKGVNKRKNKIFNQFKKDLENFR